MRPKITNTATHTATIPSGKRKNCRTRKGTVVRPSSGGGASAAGAASAGAASAGRGRSLMRQLAVARAVAHAAQRLLHVHDQGLGRVLELVEAAVELVVVRAIGLVGVGQVLEARRPLHEALQ